MHRATKRRLPAIDAHEQAGLGAHAEVERSTRPPCRTCSRVRRRTRGSDNCDRGDKHDERGDDGTKMRMRSARGGRARFAEMHARSRRRAQSDVVKTGFRRNARTEAPEVATARPCWRAGHEREATGRAVVGCESARRRDGLPVPRRSRRGRSERDAGDVRDADREPASRATPRASSYVARCSSSSRICWSRTA